LRIENNQTFFKWQIGSQWSINFGYSASQEMTVSREFAILETARGETSPRVKEELDSRTFVVANGLMAGEVMIFDPLDEAVLRQAARRKGFELLVVVQRGAADDSGAAPQLKLPDRVITLESRWGRNFPFAQGGTLIVE